MIIAEAISLTDIICAITVDASTIVDFIVVFKPSIVPLTYLESVILIFCFYIHLYLLYLRNYLPCNEPVLLYFLYMEKVVVFNVLPVVLFITKTP